MKTGSQAAADVGQRHPSVCADSHASLQEILNILHTHTRALVSGPFKQKYTSVKFSGLAEIMQHTEKRAVLFIE